MFILSRWFLLGPSVSVSGQREERPRPESCPARPLRRTHLSDHLAAGPPARPGPPRSFPSGPGLAATAPARSLLAGLQPCGGPAGRTHLQTDHFSRTANFFHKSRKLSFSHHFCIIPTPFLQHRSSIDRWASIYTLLYPVQISKPTSKSKQ